jgi:hypothetical protein
VAPMHHDSRHLSCLQVVLGLGFLLLRSNIYYAYMRWQHLLDAASSLQCCAEEHLPAFEREQERDYADASRG